MIERYQDYLEKLLKDAGMTRVFKTMKELQNCDSAHVSAVIVDKDKFEHIKQRKVFGDENSLKKRDKKLQRTTIINVIIGDTDATKCDTEFAKFLSLLDRCIYDNDGNCILIELDEAEWVSDKDSILRSKMAVQLPIQFIGGIYKDTDIVTITNDVGVEEE